MPLSASEWHCGVWTGQKQNDAFVSAWLPDALEKWLYITLTELMICDLAKLCKESEALRKKYSHYQN
jgi:hypothetical protein